MKASSALLLFLRGAVATRHNIAHDTPEVYEPRFLSDFKWHQPFIDESDVVHEHYDVTCTVEGLFHGVQYKMTDLDLDFPAGLAPWKQALQPFLSRDYPGSWDGIDPGGPNRDLVMMEYHDVPAPVREWVEEQHRIPYNDKIWLVGIFGKPKAPEGADNDGRPIAEGIPANLFDDIPAKDKVIIFAPGAMYEILPLFVAKNTDDPKCESELRDLSKYDWYMKGDGVIAWPIERTEPDDKRGKYITFKIKAQHLMESEHGTYMRKMWEKIQRAAHRQNRKIEKKEREEKRKKMESGVPIEDDDDEDSSGHDEL